MNIAIVLCLASIFASTLAQRIICYYGSWSVYRHGPAKFTVEDIDPKLCTHVIFSFVGLNTDGTVKVLDPWNDIGDEWHEGAFTKLQKLRSRNPKVKIMSAIGGWNEGSQKYSEVVNDPARRKVLVQSILDFTLTYKFDGFDLDWEYPNQRGGKPSDREAFSALIAEIKQVFQKHGLELSAAVSANILQAPESYDCKALAKYLDFINILSYDLHGSWERFTGHHTALKPHTKDLPDEKHLNVQAAIKYWVECTAAPSKVHIGLAFYGRTFTLADASQHDIRAPVIGPGPPGKYIQEPGFLPYNEICLDQTKGKWKVYPVPEQEVKYAVEGNVWVGYDDTESLTKKLEFAKSLKLGGVLVWSIETDDFRGDCGKGKYPLLTHINKMIGAKNNSPMPSSSSPPNVTSPSSTPPSCTSTKAPVSSTVPSGNGPATAKALKYYTQIIFQAENFDSSCKFCGHLFRHPRDPGSFFMCTYSGDKLNLKAIRIKCPPGLVFNEALSVCTFPQKLNFQMRD